MNVDHTWSECAPPGSERTGAYLLMVAHDYETGRLTYEEFERKLTRAVQIELEREGWRFE